MLLTLPSCSQGGKRTGDKARKPATERSCAQGRAELYTHPFHCWGRREHRRASPVSLLVVNMPAMGPWWVSFRTLLIFRHVRMLSPRNVKNVHIAHNPRVYSRVTHLLHTQNKPFPYRKQAKRAQKPATESRCAQGGAESEELYSRDQNCNLAHSHLSAHSVHYPGSGPRVGHTSHGNITQGGIKPGTKPSKNPCKTL